MANKNAGLFLAMLLAVGSAYGQSVVIDGGSIRVNASPSAKGAATVKAPKSSTAKKSKVVVANDSDDDSDTSSVIVGSSVSVATGGSAIKAASGNGYDGKGEKVYVNTDFSGQNLSRRNYAGASFTNVEAVGTNFSGSDLSKAVMTNVDLSKADFRGAKLSGAQMTNVELVDALFDGATWMDGRRCGPGSVGKCK